MLEIVVSEKSVVRKIPAPATPATPSSRFKGMLARADSLSLKRTHAAHPPPQPPKTPPVPSVPENEKSIPGVTSLSPSPSPVVVSVTSSPGPVDVKSPLPSAEPGSFPSSPKPVPPIPNPTSPDSNHSPPPPITGNGTESAVQLRSEGESVSENVDGTNGTGNLNGSVKDLEGFSHGISGIKKDDELPPPPTPAKSGSNDDDDGVKVTNGSVITSSLPPNSSSPPSQFSSPLHPHSPSPPNTTPFIQVDEVLEQGQDQVQGQAVEDPKTDRSAGQDVGDGEAHHQAILVENGV